MKIMKLHRGYERGINLRLKRGANPLLDDEHTKTTQQFNVMLTGIVEEATAITSDKNLSAAGVKAGLEELKQKGMNTFSNLDRTLELTNTVGRMKADKTNQTVKLRTALKPENEIVDAMQLSAIWNNAQYIIAQAEEEHNAKIARAKQGNVILSDEEKAFQNPFEKWYLEASETGMTSENAQFIRAVENAPFPLQLVNNNAIQKGQQLIQAAVNPDLTNAIYNGETKLAMYQHLLDAVADVLADPLAVPSN